MWDNLKTRWDSNKLQWDTEEVQVQWVSHFDNTEWVPQAPFGTWTGSAWDAGFSVIWGVVLIDTGTWADSYRPSKIRVTFSGADTALTVVFYDATQAVIIATEISTYSTGKELDIDWVPAEPLDGFKLLFQGAEGSFQLDNIEFLEEV